MQNHFSPELNSSSSIAAADVLPTGLRSLLDSLAPGNTLAASSLAAPLLPEPELAALSSAWLTEHEQRHYRRFSFAKRRSEWLFGRICAKQAVLDLLSNGTDTQLRPLDITIEAGSTGRPSVVLVGNGHPATEPDISISHSHGMAIAVAGSGLCGVDIQQLNETLYRVKTRYCDEIETALLETTMERDLVQLGLLWVCKEAIRKCFSDIVLLGFLEIHLERISMDQGHRLLHFQLDKPFQTLGLVAVATHVREPYALAVCNVTNERLRHAGIA